MWDFTCVNTISKSYLKETSVWPGAAAENAEKSYISKYQKIRDEYHMIPVAVETFGGWGPKGAHFIKNLAKKMWIQAFNSLHSNSEFITCKL